MTDRRTPAVVLTDDDLTADPFLISIRGKLHELPSVQMLKMSDAIEVAQTAQQDNVKEAFDMLLAGATKETREAVLNLPLTAGMKLMNRWLEDTAGDLGKSSNSESDSESTE